MSKNIFGYYRRDDEMKCFIIVVEDNFISIKYMFFYQLTSNS